VRVTAALDRLIRRPVALLPVWAVVPVALLCVLGGVALALRPFTSVEGIVVLAGINAILSGALVLTSRDDATLERGTLLGLGWVVLGVVVLAWPSLSVAALAIVIGAALVVNGLSDVVGAVSGKQRSERVAALIGGVASVVFGVLALAWPDITIFLVAIFFGARMVLFGVSQLTAVVKRRPRPTTEAEAAGTPARRGWLRRGLRLARAGVALLAALGFLAISLAFHKAAASTTAFYNAPSTVPGTPGELLRTERLASSAIPSDAQGWRILYTTKTSLGAPAVGSGFVLAPENLPSGPRPAIVWTHGTVGIAPACAPSLFKDVADGVPSVPEALDHGWVIIAPDYVGMGTKGPTPYLIGTGEAYSSLDAARAAHQLPGLSLSEQTVVWGHSQGGNAALWTGHLAAGYAPQLKIDGVAALAPATDLIPLAERVQSAAAGTVVTAYVIAAYSNTYRDVRFDDYVRPGASVQVRHAAQRCLTDPGLAASVIAGSGGQSIFGKALASGPLGARLKQNTPTANMGGAPLLVAGGTGDEVINIAINEKWVADQCAAGYKLDFIKYPDLTHMGVLAASSPLTHALTSWTADRFAGKPAPNTC
jgi:uncharacterized membrane protein HdeD (DUF308 family)/acetyl esterase/lipase